MEDFFDKEYFEGRGNGKYCGGYEGYEFANFYPYFNTVAQALIDVFDVSAVLDIGCAKGYFVLAFQELGIKAYGIDISNYALLNVHEKVNNRIIRGDVDRGRLPFVKDFFDLISMTEVLEHVRNYDRLLKELRIILRPGGILYITTPSRQLKSRRDASHVNVHERSFWLKVFQEHGYQLVDNSSYHKMVGAVVDGLLQQKPASNIGRILIQLGVLGKSIRRWLITLDINYHFYTNLFVLRVLK